MKERLCHGRFFAAAQFTEAALKCAFLLENRYAPYYKWTFRALSSLPTFAVLGDALSSLLFGEDTKEAARRKTDTVESVCAYMISVLQDQGLTEATCLDLEKHAYSVNDGIADGDLRNLHILAAV